MQQLNLPTYPFKIKTEGQRTQIFDGIRKKYLVLTPEEWVRQHFVHFLMSEKGVPGSLIAIEKGLVLNGMQKRCDLLVHDQSGLPLLIVECKAPKVKISQETFDQIARYNMVLKVDYLVVTNGMDHYCCRIDHKNSSYEFLRDIPLYTEITASV
jgi:hypothetical protein